MTFRRSIIWHVLAIACFLFPRASLALVDGEPHRIYVEHRLFGGVVITGNTLMTQSVVAPQVNSNLLDRSAGDVRGIPFDGELEGAYLFWSGSVAARADRTATLVAADGASFDIAADRCVTVNSLGGFFYCRADVTAQLTDHPGGDSFNGRYFVGDVEASAGDLRPNGTCRDQFCQAKYAAWSLVLVYRAESEPTLRDVFIHDGFRHLDETEDSAGIDRFTIRGFDFPEGGDAAISYFGLEGDSFLGVPPQDTDPIIQCPTCFDYMAFNGERLSDALNPPNNLFNSSSPGGFTLGLDLDTFDVSDRLETGQTQADIEVGSGDGRVERDQPGGGGESFFLGYVVLSVDRNAPNFGRAGTRLSVVPDAGSPNERVVYTLQVTNEGTRDAPNTTVRLDLPDGLTYLPGSLRVDGADPIPGEENQNPLANGFNLGNIPFRGNTDRLITFRATIAPNARAGTRLSARAQVTADTLSEPVNTNEAILVVLGALELDGITKSVRDGDGDGRYTAGEFVTYQVVIPNPNNRDVAGVRFVDELPVFLDIVQVFSATGENRSRLDENYVEFAEMSVPGGPDGGTTVTIVARIHDEEELLSDGVGPGGINGLAIDNIARVTAAGNEVESVDPNPWPGAPAGVTRFELSADVDITGAGTRKTVDDLNGPPLEPGDALRYVVQIQNTGTIAARVFVDDTFPEGLGGCQLERPFAELGCNGDGRGLRGFVTVPAGGRESIGFTAAVDQDADDGRLIQNRARLTVEGNPHDIASPGLRVVSGPDLSAATMEAIGPTGGAVVPGQTYRYRIRIPNEGNTAATRVVVTDPLPIRFASVRPLDGGRYNAGNNTVTWELAGLPPGETAELNLDVTLPAGVADGTVLDNQAAVEAAELAGALVTDDPRTAAPDDPTRVVVESTPVLVFSKRATSARVTPGGRLRYSMRIANIGTDAATNVVVEDVLPPGVFAQVTTPAGRVEGDRVVFTSAERPGLARIEVGGGVNLQIDAVLAPVLEDGLEISNQAAARVSDAEVLSDDPSTPAPADPTVVVVDATPSIELAKRVEDLNGGDVQAGDRLRYVLTVTADGDAPVSEVLVRDPLPEGLENVIPADGGVVAGGEIAWPLIPRLVPGEDDVSVQFEATVTAGLPTGTIIANQGNAVAVGLAPTPSDDPATAAPGDPTRVTVVSRPDLSTSAKIVEPTEARPGDQVAWQIVVANTGTDDAVNVVVRDPFPVDAFTDLDTGGGRLAGGVITWNLPRLQAGAVSTFTVVGRIAAGLDDGAVVSNQATVSARGIEALPTDDPTTPEEDDPTALRIVAEPALAVSKTITDVNGGTLRPGEDIIYTIAVENEGSGTARNAVIEDPIPGQLQRVFAIDGEIANGIARWDVGDVAPGARIERTITARVRAPLPNGFVVSNQARARADNLTVARVLSDDPTTPEVGDPTRRQVISAADFTGATLSVEDLNDGDFRPGDRVRYTLVVTNVGDDAGRNTTVASVLPDTLTELAAPDGVVSGQRIEWALGDVAPAASRRLVFEASVVAPLANGTVISQRGEISADGVAAPFLTDDPSTPAADATSFTVTSSSAVELSKSVGSSGGQVFRPGDVATYTIEVANAGDAVAEAVVVEDQMPAPLQGPFRANAGGVVDGRTIRWTLPSVSPGAPQVLTVTGTLPNDVADGTVVRNVVRSGPLTAEVTFEVENQPSLATSTKRVVADAFPGGRVVYEIDVANSGRQAALEVQLTDPLPEGLVYVGSAPEGAQGPDGVLRWAFDRVEPGQAQQVRIEARVADAAQDGQRISNQASLTALGLAPILTDDPDTPEADDATTFVVSARPELVLEKSLTDDNGGAFVPGDSVTYTLRLTNEGAGPARAVEVVDPIDALLQAPVAVDGEILDRVAIWRLPEVSAGESAELVLRARISGEAGDGDTFTNQFAARIGGGEVIRSPLVEATVEVGGVAVVKDVEALEPAGFAPGALLEFTIAVTNERERGLVDVGVNDPFDTEALFEIQPLDGGVLLPGEGEVFWTPDTTGALRFVPGGETVELRVRARIRPEVEPGTTIRNLVRVGVRGDPVLFEADVELAVEDGPRYAVVKQVDENAAEPGTNVGYTIEVTNVGASAGVEVRLQDVLPDTLEYVRGSTRVNGARVGDVDRGAPFAGEGLLIQAGGDEDGVLRPDGQVEVTFTARIRDEAPSGAEVLNTAVVADRDGNRSEDTVGFEVRGRPGFARFEKDYRIETGTDPSRAQVGGVIRWGLRLENGPESVLEDVEILDELPPEVEYIEGSLRLNGESITDADDGDPGRVEEGRILIQLEALPPDRDVLVSFETRVLAGPAVRNQAFATYRGMGGSEPSDDGGVDENSPTIVPVDELPRREVTLEKAVFDPTGAPALPGELLRYSIKVINDGTVDLPDLTVVDHLPIGMSLAGEPTVPEGVEVVVEPPPNGRFGAGLVRFEGIGLAAGETVEIDLATRIDPRTEQGGEWCNVAEVEGAIDGGGEDEACVEVVVRKGRLGGTTFEDLDGDGVFDPDADYPFAGMTVRLYDPFDPNGAPVAEGETSGEGEFLMPEMTEGVYLLRAFTKERVLVATVDAVSVLGDTLEKADIPIDPSGRVYDSVSGDLLDGAELFIYRDEDPADDDPYDPESIAARVLVDPAELEAPSMQGQRTAHGGFYRFAVRTPGRYFVEVVPPGLAYVGPSLLVPPVPGVAFTDDPQRRVVPNDIPSVAPDADRTYFTLFDLEDASDEFFNNHIPLDPISSLVDLQKRALRAKASFGEVVTYEIDLVNRSERDFLFDPDTRVGGVFIQDVLPRGLKYVAKSAYLARVRNGREEPLFADDPPPPPPFGTRILRFGQTVAEDGEAVQRGFDLHAGEALRLRYQVVVDVRAKAKSTLTNRAVALADGSVPISDEAQADILIVPDADFDQGIILGRVWCDADRDGRQGEGELGLGGVRLYLDDGVMAVTDPHGLFHLKDIDPGTHAVKLDADSLLPGAALTTPAVRTFSVTRGLPVKLRYGVTCPAETVEGAAVEAAPGQETAVLEAVASRYVVVTGHVDTLSAAVDAKRCTVPGRMRLGVEVNQDDAESPPKVVFRTNRDPSVKATRWAIRAGVVGAVEPVVLGGDGAPPAAVEWSGKATAALESETPYIARLEVVTDAGILVGSAPVSFVVGVAKPPAERVLATFPGDGFDKRERLGRDFKKAVEEQIAQLKEAPGQVIVRVHHDDSMGPFTSRSMTRRRAQAVINFMVETHGLDPEKLVAEGVGGSMPIMPNITQRNRRRNRRVEWIVKQEVKPKAEVVTPKPAPPVVKVDFDEVAPMPDGRFGLVAMLPEDGIVEVFMQATDGRRAVCPISVRSNVKAPPAQADKTPKAAPTAMAGAQAAAVSVRGQLPKTLSVGRYEMPLSPPHAQVKAPSTGKIDEGVRLRLKAPEDARGWRLAVADAQGALVFSKEGQGAPPSGVTWTPKAEGTFQHRLSVHRPGGIDQSAPGRLVVGEGAALETALGAWRVFVDGRPIAVGADGGVGAEFAPHQTGAVLVTVEWPDGQRRTRFVGLDAVRTPAAEASLASGSAPVSGDTSAGESRTEKPTKGSPSPSKSRPAAQPTVSGGIVAGGGAVFAPTAGQPVDGGEQPALAAKTKAPVALPLSAKERNVLDAFAKAELQKTFALALKGQGAGGPAGKLSVELPAEGATLTGLSVPIRGQTAPGNQVFLNGREVVVDGEGRFADAARLAPGAERIEVRTLDPDGNRGTIERKVVAPTSTWFVLAIAEGTVGKLGAELDGVGETTAIDVADRLFLHGQTKAFIRGTVQGKDLLGGLFDAYEVTAHLDSTRRDEFTAAFEQMIDPARFYPVYGDTAEETRLVHTRGPVYVLIEADESTLNVGSFNADVDGLELFRYDRALYGVRAELDVEQGDFRHELEGFAADQDLGQRHAYVELRGTGGSLYYLPHRDVVEGSERVYRVERDRVSGLERSRTPLARNTDYTIRYDDGRLLIKSPVSSVSGSQLGITGDPTSGALLDGHATSITVEYDHTDPRHEGETVVGVRARETWKDKISVGGGYLQEGRADAGPDYTLWGADLRLSHGRKTKFEAEIAQSESTNGANLVSLDGGLSYRPFHDRTREDVSGRALLIRGGLELDDLVGKGDTDHWYTEGYWQYLAPNFYAGGSASQQGMEKFGVATEYLPAEGHRLYLRHDGVVGDAPSTQGETTFQGFERADTRLGYGYKDGPLKLDTEFALNQQDAGYDDPVSTIGTLGVGGTYALDDRWTLVAEQEVVVKGDTRYHQTTGDLFSSMVGVRYRLAETLSVELLEVVRWSGDNATQIGLRTEIDDRHVFYVQERLMNERGEQRTATVVGAEERWGKKRNGRAYGEYQLETGASGRRNRAVMGVGKHFEIAEGLTLDAGYERSQVSGGVGSELSRDALSLGGEYLASDRFKLSGRYEIRYEDHEEGLPQRDVYHFLALNNVTAKLAADWTLMGRLNFSHTLDLEYDATQAEILEWGLGLSYRPVGVHWLAVLTKYGKRYEQRPIDVALELPGREENDVVTFMPMFELPYDLQLVGKIAYRRYALRTAQIPTVTSHSLLALSRLNYHLAEQWDAGVEYRYLANGLSFTKEHGALLELNYILKEHFRLGVGYNFTKFSDEEFSRLDEETHGGPFFRVVGQY